MDESLLRTARHRDRIFFPGMCPCLSWSEGQEDNSAKRVALYVGSGLSNSPSSIWFQVRLPFQLTRITQSHQGTVKENGKARPEGQPAGQRGRKQFKTYRREEQRLKSRGRRGTFKPHGLEMLLQRGAQHLLGLPSLETQEEGQRGKTNPW